MAAGAQQVAGAQLGSQLGAGAQQVGAGAHDAGAQQLGAGAHSTGAQQLGSGEQQLGSGAQQLLCLCPKNRKPASASFPPVTAMPANRATTAENPKILRLIASLLVFSQKGTS